MVKSLLGKKIGMTRYFLEEGKSVSVTLVRVGPCVVVQKKTTEKDGYEAIQVGFEDRKERRINKPLMGHFNVAGNRYFSISGSSRLRRRISSSWARSSNQTFLPSGTPCLS